MAFTNPTGEALFTGDYWVITDQSAISKHFRLRETPVPGSTSVYWNGLYLSPSNYILQNTLLSFPSIPVVPGDEISVQYAIGE